MYELRFLQNRKSKDFLKVENEDCFKIPFFKHTIQETLKKFSEKKSKGGYPLIPKFETFFSYYSSRKVPETGLRVH